LCRPRPRRKNLPDPSPNSGPPGSEPSRGHASPRLPTFPRLGLRLAQHSCDRYSDYTIKIRIEICRQPGWWFRRERVARSRTPRLAMASPCHLCIARPPLPRRLSPHPPLPVLASGEPGPPILMVAPTQNESGQSEDWPRGCVTLKSRCAGAPCCRRSPARDDGPQNSPCDHPDPPPGATGIGTSGGDGSGFRRGSRGVDAAAPVGFLVNASPAVAD